MLKYIKMDNNIAFYIEVSKNIELNMVIISPECYMQKIDIM